MEHSGKHFWGKLRISEQRVSSTSQILLETHNIGKLLLEMLLKMLLGMLDVWSAFGHALVMHGGAQLLENMLEHILEMFDVRECFCK